MRLSHSIKAKQSKTELQLPQTQCPIQFAEQS